MGFVDRVLWILKALWIVLSETMNIIIIFLFFIFFNFFLGGDSPEKFIIGLCT